jgi:hypothetical protein
MIDLWADLAQALKFLDARNAPRPETHALRPNPPHA